VGAMPDVKIDDLTPSTYGHNLVARVVASEVVVDKARVDGSEIRYAIGDHATGHCPY
jgi:hypothetical protein